MNKNKTIIDALAEAIRLEKSMVDYYKHAFEKNHHGRHADQYQLLEDRHFVFVGRLDAQREKLQHEGGEGVIGNAIESIGKAIFDTIAGLPVGAIRAETDLTLPSFIKAEEELRAVYSALAGEADPETAAIAAAGVESCEENIQRLNAMMA